MSGPAGPYSNAAAVGSTERPLTMSSMIGVASRASRITNRNPFVRRSSPIALPAIGCRWTLQTLRCSLLDFDRE